MTESDNEKRRRKREAIAANKFSAAMVHYIDRGKTISDRFKHALINERKTRNGYLKYLRINFWTYTV